MIVLPLASNVTPMSRGVDRPSRDVLRWVVFWVVVALVLLSIPTLLYLHYALTWPFGYVYA
ncbi:hypothetical protein GCM10027568_09600 [Humibacter soli]